jgi:hypothetical protein
MFQQALEAVSKQSLVRTSAYRFGRAVQAGRVLTNCYRVYPAHAAFGGHKQSSIGRENHKMILDHYQQTKTCWSAARQRLLGSSEADGSASAALVAAIESGEPALLRTSGRAR